MSGTDLLCLNRIIKPQIPLEEFLQFTAGLGIKYVEVRNDFTDKGIFDGLSDAAPTKPFKAHTIKALTINDVYPFEEEKEYLFYGSKGKARHGLIRRNESRFEMRILKS